MSVICICVLCCILQLLFSGNSHITSLLKMITGITVALAVFAPILRNDSVRIDVRIDELIADRELAVQEGEQVALESISARIKQTTESYILEKANELGLDIQAEVTLREEYPPVPYGVTIKGTVSPYGRKQLQTYLLQNLEIAEENQIWIS